MNHVNRKTVFGSIGLLWVAATLGLGVVYVRLPPSPDDAVFDYCGWVLKSGGTLFVDAADTSWPAMYRLHELSTLLFGNHLWSFRLLDYFILLATCFLLAGFTRHVLGTLAGVLVIPLYQTMYVSQNVWFIGQRDILAAPLLVTSAFALLLRIEGRSLAWCIVGGVAAAGAVLFRPTYLSLPLFLAAGDFIFRKRSDRTLGMILRDHAIAMGSLMAVLALCALAGWKSGALREWYHVAVRFILEVYARKGVSPVAMTLELLKFVAASWHWMIGVALLGFVTDWRKRPLPAFYLCSIAGVTLISFFVQRKGFIYHVGPLFPLMALCMASAAASATQNLSAQTGSWPLPRTARRLLAAGLCVLLCAGLGKKMWGNLHSQVAVVLGRMSTREMLKQYPAGEGVSLEYTGELVDYVRARVPEDGRFLFWGRPMIFNYLAKRRSPSRFAAFACLDQARPFFSLYESWESELRRSLEEHPPEVICLVRTPDPGGYQDLPQPPRERRLSGVVADLLEARYRLDQSFGPVDCFRPKGR